MMPVSNKLRSNKCVHHVIIRPKPGDKAKCLIRFDNQTIQGSMGGTGRTIFKREGDGATPIAEMRVLNGYFKPSRKNTPHYQIAMSPSSNKLAWCDAPLHPSYNKPVRQPFSASCENMARNDILYDFVIVLDWNITCRKRNCGSAIFFHVAKPGYPPTQGCIAIAKRDMMRFIPYITRKTCIKVI